MHLPTSNFKLNFTDRFQSLKRKKRREKKYFVFQKLSQILNKIAQKLHFRKLPTAQLPAGGRDAAVAREEVRTLRRPPLGTRHGAGYRILLG